MINATLFRREIKAHYILTLIFVGVAALYTTVIIMMFDPELGASLNMMAQSMPGIFAAFGMLNVGSTLIEFLANYLYGFLLIAFPLVYVIMLSNHLVAKYVDNTSMAYLLATPNKRVKIALTQAVGLLFGVFVIVLLTALLAIVSSELQFPGKLAMGEFIMLNIGWFGLLVFLSGICFFISCLSNDTKKSYGISAGICITFLLVQMISQVDERLADLQYATPLTLFDPQKILAGDANSVLMFLVLYAVGIVFFIAGISAFCKRDLPI